MHEEYSSFGLTRALYAWSLFFCEFTLRFLLRRFRVWLALEVILLICLSHFRFDCKVTPRYFMESDFSRE